MTGTASRRPLSWLGGLLTLYLAVPLIAFAIRLAGSGDRGFSEPGLWDAVATSAEGATISTALIVASGVPLAHWLARSRSRGTAVVGALVQIPLALPPVMSGILLIYLVGPYTLVGRLSGGRLTDSLAGVVLAQTFVAAPFLVIAAKSAFAGVDPVLDDLAATLGHRPLARFFRVDLPIAAAGIRAGMLLTWLRAVGEYGATVLLAYHPYTLPVFTYVQFSSSGIPTTQAPTALAVAAAGLVLLLSRLRLPRFGKVSVLPRPRAPRLAAPQPVAFDLDLSVGDFRLQLAYAASSHRIAIVGPSGAGKSITLRALAGLFGAQQVRIGGVDVSTTPTEARRFGYVPQHHGLFPGRTVAEQVVFATDADPAVAAWWLQTLHLDGLERRLPEHLSGGQRQRVSLAQAFAHQPRVVLLDEPFSALDTPVRRELRREVRRLQREAGLTTVLVTHDPSEAAYLADEILVIDGGRLLQAGPRAEVFERPASLEVARLLGVENVQRGVVDPAGIRCGDCDVGTSVDVPVGSEVLWAAEPVLDPQGTYRAVVTDVADFGTSTMLSVQLADGPEFTARGSATANVGDRVRLRLDDVRAWRPEQPGKPEQPESAFAPALG